jgi:von Willebrand factor type A domain-containing protein
VNNRIVSVIALAILANVACSQKGDESPAPGAPAMDARATAAPESEAPVAAPPEPEAPATLTDVNLVAADAGGAIEELTGFYGPGLTGNRLIDGRLDPTWRSPEDWWPGGMFNNIYWTKYPQEAVFSFYERQPALVGALTFVLPEAPTVEVRDDPSTAPAEVEVWTSMDNASERFARVATATVEARGGEQTFTFPATKARFVKLRLLSGATARVVEIAEVRVLESVREGYGPLFDRVPDAKLWKGSPREAAQRGLEWLQQSAVDWSAKRSDPCFGCHVQAQALMGQRVALEQGYRVSMPAMQALVDMMHEQQTPEGALGRNHETTSAVFGAIGFAQAAEASGRTSDPALFKTVDYVLRIQAKDGSLHEDSTEPPIMQGGLMMTGNALVAFEWAAAHSRDPKYRQAAERALAWIVANEPVTTQDLVFKIVAVNHYGTPEQKRATWPLAEVLAAQQAADGGWKEIPAMEGSNAFATGQVLYAFKQAGVSVRSAMFQRGVDYLLKTQVREPTPDNGSWKAIHTQSQRATDFAPTMWAVIGLAGAYGTEPLGALQIVKEGDKIAARNLEIVLDVSGSMNAKLGDGNRWDTALKALKEVVDTLPEDLNVGLRVYGHRYSSKSAQTCQDTELVVPLAKLDREQIVKTASALKPRGETPLIRSILKSVGDLNAAGGGSVILITDGEESCKGNAKAAAKEIKASGVNLTLNIVGFTLTSEAVENELSTLAGSTGGRYYGAQDGAQLARAVKLAALQRLPYDILDVSGKVLASGQTGELSRELPPGRYRIRIEALGQELEESLTIVPDQTTILALAVEGDRFVLRHQGSST